MINRDKRFWSKVDQRGPDECWNWKASTTNGYGVFWTGSKSVGAHRYAYVYKTGRPISSNTLICHHCDNPACCNPNHLFEGTAKDNFDDMVSKGRQQDVSLMQEASRAAKVRYRLSLDSLIAYFHPNRGSRPKDFKRRVLPYNLTLRRATNEGTKGVVYEEGV